MYFSNWGLLSLMKRAKWEAYCCLQLLNGREYKTEPDSFQGCSDRMGSNGHKLQHRKLIKSKKSNFYCEGDQTLEKVAQKHVDIYYCSICFKLLIKVNNWHWIPFTGTVFYKKNLGIMKLQCREHKRSEPFLQTSSRNRFWIL